MEQLDMENFFEGIKSKLAGSCSLERYEYVISSSHFLLDGYFEEIYAEITQSLKHLKTTDEEVLKDFRSYIYLQGNIYQNSNSIYSRKCAAQMDRIFRLVDGQLNYLLKQSAGDKKSEQTTKNVKTPKLSDYNRPDLNTKQILALIKILQRNGAFNKDLTDTALTDSFGKLTGYSSEQLRKNLTEYNKNEILFKQEEIQQLKDIAVQISKELDKLPLK